MVKRNPIPTRGGLSLLMVICAITCILLVFNSAFIVAFYEGLSQSFGQLETYPKLKQAILFAAPLLMLFVEWKAYDIVMTIIQRRKVTSPFNRNTK
ncbi:MAG: hypothetical protein VX738_16140 [Planctomycetota bacterium]|nr:hypothetical protein [Planctomycetota bacterium]